ncbi:MAG: hypothetical protein WBA44_09570 [Mesorhizobium sp.]
MTKRPETARLSDALIEGARRYIDEALNGFNARIKALETASHELKFMGVHQRALDYRRNNLITHDGSLWIALKDTPSGKPGASDDWQLVAKRGADMRDAK